MEPSTRDSGYWSFKNQIRLRTDFLLNLPHYRRLEVPPFETPLKEFVFWNEKLGNFIRGRMTKLRRMKASGHIRATLRRDLEHVARHGKTLEAIALGTLASEDDPRPLGRYDLVLPADDWWWRPENIFSLDAIGIDLPETVASLCFAEKRIAFLSSSARTELAAHEIVKQIVRYHKQSVCTDARAPYTWENPLVTVSFSQPWDLLDSSLYWPPLCTAPGSVTWLTWESFDHVKKSTGKFSRKRCGYCGQFIEQFARIGTTDGTALIGVAYGGTGVVEGAGWAVGYQSQETP